MGLTPVRKIPVEIMLYADQEERLKALLPYWQNYVSKEGKRPFKNMTIDDLFQTIIEIGSYHMVNAKIRAEELRQEILLEKEETPEVAASRESR